MSIDIKEKVKERYGKIALVGNTDSCCMPSTSSSSCCGGSSSSDSNTRIDITRGFYLYYLLSKILDMILKN